MITVTYKYKIYKQNRNHEKRLQGILRTAARIYNHCIALHKRYYRLYGKHLNKFKLQKHIAKMKRRCFHEWRLLNSQAAQQISERIDRAYSAFFKRDAKQPPTFKGRRKYKSITYKNFGYTVNGNVFTINSLKLRLKFHLSRPIDGKIQTVCLKRDAVGDWWLTFTIRKEEHTRIAKPMTGKTAGFDFGLKHFLTSADGSRIEAPQYLLRSLDALRIKSRHLSRKVKGSNSRRRARLELARCHRRVSNRRSEFHWQLATRLVSEYDTICLETLNVKAMQQMWGRKIGDLAFSDFVRILESQCAKYGKRLVKIDQWEATSKTCSVCGHKEKEMPLNVRRWTCPDCGTIHDRDINAAKNILRVGTSTLAGDGVRLAKQAVVVEGRIPLL